MSLRVALLVLLVACASACAGWCLRGTPPVPAPEPAPAVVTGDAVYCGSAGLRLVTLGCHEARPDFEKFCRETIALGVPLNAKCLAGITTCAEVDRCR